ncbi:MAG TPA: tetratricopeptide repeat protein [Terriglobales bacterium]
MWKCLQNPIRCRTSASRFLATAVVLATALFHGCAVYAAGQNTATAHSDQGLQLAHAGDLTGAESELRSAVALAPNNPEFLFNLATVLAMDKKLEESASVFKRALKLDPSNLTARRYLAANLWQLHEYPEAKANLEIILKHKNDDAPSRLLLGMVLENMKDYAAAAQMLASVPEQVKQRPESIGALAVSYYHVKEVSKARNTIAMLQNHPAGPRAVLLGVEIADQNADYETAERLLLSAGSYAGRADFEYRLATVQYHAHKFEQSEQTLLHLISTGNGSAEVFNLLGWCYQKLGQSEPAVKALEQAVNLQPNEESNFLDLEKILLGQNKVGAALVVAKRAADACPKSPRIFITQGELQVRATQFTNAVASYRRAVELDSHDADAGLGLADSEYAADLRKESYRDFELGLRKFPRDPRFPLHYALALLKEDESGGATSERRATELLKSAVSLDPSSADAHYHLGELALKDERVADALLEYRKAAKLDPNNPKIHFGLSRVYRRLGRTEEASREASLFEKLQEAKPGAPAAPPQSQ